MVYQISSPEQGACLLAGAVSAGLPRAWLKVGGSTALTGPRRVGPMAGAGHAYARVRPTDTARRADPLLSAWRGGLARGLGQGGAAELAQGGAREGGEQVDALGGL